MCLLILGLLQHKILRSVFFLLVVCFVFVAMNRFGRRMEEGKTFYLLPAIPSPPPPHPSLERFKLSSYFSKPKGVDERNHWRPFFFHSIISLKKKGFKYLREWVGGERNNTKKFSECVPLVEIIKNHRSATRCLPRSSALGWWWWWWRWHPVIISDALLLRCDCYRNQRPGGRGREEPVKLCH